MPTPMEIAESAMADLAPDLVHSCDPVVSWVAETNATGIGSDGYEVLDADWVDADRDQVSFEARVDLSGDQDPDHPFNGTSLAVEISGLVENDGERWRIERGYEARIISSNRP